MPRKATGNTYKSNGRWYARVTVDKAKRQSFALPTCDNETAADARAAVLASMAKDLRAAKVAPVDRAKLLESAGAATEGKALAELVEGERAAPSVSPR